MTPRSLLQSKPRRPDSAPENLHDAFDLSAKTLAISLGDVVARVLSFCCLKSFLKS